MIIRRDEKFVWNYLLLAILASEEHVTVEYDGEHFLINGVKYKLFNKEAGMLSSDEGEDEVRHLPTEVVSQTLEAADASDYFGKLGDGLHFDIDLKVASFVSLASAKRFKARYSSWTVETHNGQTV